MERQTTPDHDPILVVVVASWYPSVEDPAAGRFVADQVEALARGGRVAPTVISFDPVPLVQGATARAAQVPVVDAMTTEAVLVTPRLFQPAAYGVSSPIPIARVTIAEGSTPELGTTAAARHRAVALTAIGDRLLGGEDVALPAIVHAHAGFPDGAAAAALADRLGRPLIITEHATFLDRIIADHDQHAAYASAGARAARIVAVSEFLATRIRSAFPELAARVAVIPNAVAVDEFRAAPIGERRADELLFVGYRKEVKGIDVLLDGFARVVAERPGARLRLIGGSPDPSLEARLHAQAAGLGLGDRVAFEAGTGRAAVADAMAEASVFVHPSRFETFGVVAAEALAAGLPVVATRSGGVDEVLGPDPLRLGALVDIDDPASLATAILNVLERRDRYDPETLRRSAVDRFSAATVATRLVGLYEEVLGEWKAHPSAATAPPRAAPICAGASHADRAARCVVVGLDRAAAARRLAPLPPEVLARIALITAPGPDAVPPGVTVREVSDAGGRERDGRTDAADASLGGRVKRFLSDPAGAYRRRADRLAGIEGEAQQLAPAIDRAIAELVAADGGDGAGLEVAFLDGRDVLVAADRVRAAGCRISSGSIRAIADRVASDAFVSTGPAAVGPG